MIRLAGEHVIPVLDTDPVHRTTRMREEPPPRPSPDAAGGSTGHAGRPPSLSGTWTLPSTTMDTPDTQSAASSLRSHTAASATWLAFPSFSPGIISAMFVELVPSSGAWACR